MFFALNTFLWQQRFTVADLSLLAHVRDLGADIVEIQCPDLSDFPVAAVAAELDRIGLGCTLCTSPRDYARCLIADDVAGRMAAIDDLRHAIVVARDLGATLVSGPLYAPPWCFSGARTTESQWRWAVDGFQAVVDDLARTGVTLAIEPINRFETFFLNTAAQGVALCQAIGNEWIGLLLDTAHMAIEEQDPVGAIRASKDWLRHLHLPENNRGTPGSGTTDWPGLFRALAEIGYKGGCAIESFPFPDPASAMGTRTWRDLATSADALGRDGLTFLRRGYAASVRAIAR